MEFKLVYDAKRILGKYDSLHYIWYVIGIWAIRYTRIAYLIPKSSQNNEAGLYFDWNLN